MGRATPPRKSQAFYQWISHRRIATNVDATLRKLSVSFPIAALPVLHNLFVAFIGVLCVGWNDYPLDDRVRELKRRDGEAVSQRKESHAGWREDVEKNKRDCGTCPMTRLLSS